MDWRRDAGKFCRVEEEGVSTWDEQGPELAMELGGSRP